MNIKKIALVMVIVLVLVTVIASLAVIFGYIAY